MPIKRDDLNKTNEIMQNNDSKNKQEAELIIWNARKQSEDLVLVPEHSGEVATEVTNSVICVDDKADTNENTPHFNVESDK